MKTLKESLFSKKNLNKNRNPYGITKDDMVDDIEGFPVGVVVQMMKEQENQGNEPDVKVLQKDRRLVSNGFNWVETEDGEDFWYKVISLKDFNLFFKKYPE